MKYWSTEHIFNYPWKNVTEAAWKKYPNEQNTNVLTLDVFDRKCSSEGVLSSTRIFGSKMNLPRFITALLGMPEVCYAVEHSVVDLKNEKMTLKTLNYTFWGMLACHETLIYEPNGINASETKLTQSAQISINGIQFSNYFEGVIANGFESTSKRGRSALQQVLDKIKIENMLEAVKYELNDLSQELDKTTTKLDCEFHLTDRINKLGDDLEDAVSFMNSEFNDLSSKIKSELNQLISKLDQEINQISIEFDMKSDSRKHNKLIDAVQQAGISVKPTACRS